MSVRQGVLPFRVEDQKPHVRRGRVKLRHQVLDEVALAVTGSSKHEAALALEPTDAEADRHILENALAVGQMAEQRGVGIIFKTHIAQECKRGVRRYPNLAAKSCECPLTNGKFKPAAARFGLQVTEHLHLQVVSQHLAHERRRQRGLRLRQIDEVGVPALADQLPRRVVAADPTHERRGGAQFDQQELSEAWQAVLAMWNDNVQFQLMRQR